MEVDGEENVLGSLFGDGNLHADVSDGDENEVLGTSAENASDTSGGSCTGTENVSANVEIHSAACGGKLDSSPGVGGGNMLPANAALVSRGARGDSDVRGCQLARKAAAHAQWE